MAALAGDLSRQIMSHSDAARAFRPWWDNLEDSLMYSLVIMGELNLIGNFIKYWKGSQAFLVCDPWNWFLKPRDPLPKTIDHFHSTISNLKYHKNSNMLRYAKFGNLNLKLGDTKSLRTAELLVKVTMWQCTELVANSVVLFYQQNFAQLYKWKELEAWPNFYVECSMLYASKIRINLMEQKMTAYSIDELDP